MQGWVRVFWRSSVGHVHVLFLLLFEIATFESSMQWFFQFELLSKLSNLWFYTALGFDLPNWLNLKCLCHDPTIAIWNLCHIEPDSRNRQLVGEIPISRPMLTHWVHLFLKDDGPRNLARRAQEHPYRRFKFTKISSVYVCVYVCVMCYIMLGFVMLCNVMYCNVM